MSGPFIGAAQAARLLQAGQASSVELTTEFVRRAQAHAALGAFLHLDAEAALAQARAADAQRAAGGAAAASPLLGVPIAHKDIFVTEDAPPPLGPRCSRDTAAPSMPPWWRA